MKILVLTGYDDRIADWAPVAERSWKAYAKLHHYDFHCHRDYPPSLGHPAWQKLRLIVDRITSYEWIFWTDIDSVVTNPKVTLESFIDPKYTLIVSRDWGPPEESPWSSGHMLIQCGPEAEILFRLAQKRTRYMDESTWDQKALQEVCAGIVTFEELLKVLPSRALNAVPLDAAPALEPWQEGDFLAHITGWVKPERKGPLLEKYAKKTLGESTTPD